MQTFDRYLLPCLIALAAVIYYPFLDSPFVFDDFYNLFKLEQVSDTGWLAFIAEGFAGPTGRPITMFSFALQHHSWPGHPMHFKSINLCIHLLNGVFIWFISRVLIAVVEQRRRRQNLFALLCTALWLLHPMHLTTVLYTVQRMTQLSCLFTLIGVAGYLVLRARIVRVESLASYIYTAFYVLACAALATLSKENGVLLLLYVLVLEFTLLAKLPAPKQLTKWLWLVTVCPLLILLLYLAVQLPVTLKSYYFHEFNAYDRVLTQAVVLLAYVKDLALPAYGAFTLHHDGFPVSRGLFEPSITAVAVVAILALLVVAIIRRKKNPVFGFCVLWFLAGHAMESSHLNLEMYFEHRNYLPALAICLGITNLIRLILERLSSPVLPGVIVAGYLSLFLAVLLMEGGLWKKPLEQAMLWARLHPDSFRSVNNLGSLYFGYQDYERALDVYKKMADNWPESIYPFLQLARIHECRLNKNHDWTQLLYQAGTAKPVGQHVIALLDVMTVEIYKNQCQPDTSVNMAKLIDKLLANKKFGYMNAYLYQFGAMLANMNDMPEQALMYIDEAILRRPETDNYNFRIYLLNLMHSKEEVDGLQKK